MRVEAGTYRLGEGHCERSAELPGVLIGRYPVVNAHVARFVRETGRAVAPDLASRLAAPMLGDHPVTGFTFAEATAFCAWVAGPLGGEVRLPTGDEWEAAARGVDARHWPWGDAFDETRCVCVESGWGHTAPVTAHPDGASPWGAEQMAGNVWEWVTDPTEGGLWRSVRGGSHLDFAWGVRAARTLAADPTRGTPTTGFRLAAPTADPQVRGG